MKLDLARFRKISGDKHSTLLRHEDGHEIRLNHEALDPKQRGDLAKMPAAYADGGQVKSQRQKNSEEFQKGFNQSEDFVGNVKRALGIGDSQPAPQPSPSPKPEQQGYADGGDVQAGAPPAQAPVVVNVNSGGSAQQSAATPQAPAIAPDLQAKRDIYNSWVSGGNAQAPNKDQSFGPNGEAPNNFSAPAWKVAEEKYAQQQQSALEGQQQAIIGAQEQNKARVAAGLPPIDVPNAPQAPQGSPQGGGLQQPQGIAPQPGQPPQDPYGNQAYSDAYVKGLNEQKAGLAGQAAAEGQVGTEQAATLHRQVQNQMDVASDYKQHYQALDQERADFMHDIQEQHIDPNHYLNSQGTAQRISTSIGLILGGMGAGLTGGPNYPMQALQANIDRDIAAQQAELGKKESLLSANFKQFGNLRDATDMTRVMQNDIVSNQLKESAAKSADPAAKARALQAAGALDMQAAPVLSQIAMRKSLMNGAAQGKVAPEMVIRALVPKEQQKAVLDQLKEAQDMSATRDNLLQTFDKVAKINTLSNRAANPIQATKQVDALLAGVIPSLSKATAGRYTEQDAGTIEKMLKTLGGDDKTMRVQRAALDRLASEKMHYPELKQWGIDPTSFGKYNAQGQSRIPESAPILKK